MSIRLSVYAFISSSYCCHSGSSIPTRTTVCDELLVKYPLLLAVAVTVLPEGVGMGAICGGSGRSPANTSPAITPRVGRIVETAKKITRVYIRAFPLSFETVDIVSAMAK
ncbi:MAG: hypothetical protein BWX50_00962 [Euryarchaeota archaeon ADurb.Bin009]|nr:MAG: hypothetical protein BWX50_00962 [Euryarchaeota archaeon ADurb.Bin009]